MRNGRWYTLLPYLFNKWDIKSINDEVGKTIYVDKNGKGKALQPKPRTYKGDTKNLRYGHQLACACMIRRYTAFGEVIQVTI